VGLATVPTCVTVVPYTRTILNTIRPFNIIVTRNKGKIVDFWHDQPFGPIPAVADAIWQRVSLTGKRIVSKVYIGKTDLGYLRKVAIRDTVLDLWVTARPIIHMLARLGTKTLLIWGDFLIKIPACDTLANVKAETFAPHIHLDLSMIDMN
jgi:hypothetical protein